jgi:hypothetical protein
MATLIFEGTKFGAPGNQNYYKIKTGLMFDFKTRKMYHPLRQKAYGYYISASDLFQIELPEKAKMNSFIQFGYLLEKTEVINPFNIITFFESSKSFQKASITFNYKYSYSSKRSGLDVTTYLGTMLKSSSGIPFYNLSPSGRKGLEQYLYQGFFPDRFSANTKTFWSRQMTLSEGGLVSPINEALGYSRWLLSISITSSLPGITSRLPIKPFVTFLFNDHGLDNKYTSTLFYEAGFKAGIWNFFELYCPLLVSGNVGSIQGTIKERVRIVLNLDAFNQVKFDVRLFN